MTHTQPQVLVIGLDGVPLDLIRRWTNAGHLPILQKLMADGATGDLRSTTPPTSGPSWSAFMTGMNPGKTGIYDFLYRRPNTYAFSPISTQHRNGKPLWTLLSEAKKTVGVLNVPVTHPIEEVNGFLVSGFMTPYGDAHYTHPQGLIPMLKHAIGDYHIYPTETYSETRARAFFQAAHDLLEMRTQAALWLMDTYQLDFFMTVFFDTDRILHQTWHHLDPEHPWHDRVVDKASPEAQVLGYFQHLDDCIGRLVNHVNEDTTVIVLSDHGMGPAHNFVILNNWLAKAGLLKFKEDPISRLKHTLFDAGFTLRNVHQAVDKLGLAKPAEYKGLYSVDGLLKRFFLSFRNVDWSETKAYSFGRHTGPIFINVKGREPQGIVNRGAEYEDVCCEIEAKAREFCDPMSGRPMIGQILRRHDIYNGPEYDRAPDLTLLPMQPTDIFFGLADFGDNRIVAPVYRYSGMHRDYGMLIMHGPDIQSGISIRDAIIWDIAPTILHIMGESIPSTMDGQVLMQALDPAIPEPVSIRIGSETASTATCAVPYSLEDENSIIDRLRNLGYLG